MRKNYFRIYDGEVEIGQNTVPIQSKKDEFGALTISLKQFLGTKRDYGSAILSSGFGYRDVRVLSGEFQEMITSGEIHDVLRGGVARLTKEVLALDQVQKVGVFKSPVYGDLEIDDSVGVLEERHIGCRVLALAGVTMDFLNYRVYRNELEKGIVPFVGSRMQFPYRSGLPLLVASIQGHEVLACLSLNRHFHCLKDAAFDKHLEYLHIAKSKSNEHESRVFGIRLSVGTLDAGYDAPIELVSNLGEIPEVDLAIGLPFLLGKYIVLYNEQFEVGDRTENDVRLKGFREVPVIYSNEDVQCLLSDLIPEIETPIPLAIDLVGSSSVAIHLSKEDFAMLEQRGHLQRDVLGEAAILVNGTRLSVAIGDKSVACIGMLKELGLRVDFASGGKAGVRENDQIHRLFVRRS